MNKFNALVMMQLKDKVDFSFTKSKKATIFKVVLGILKFAIITAVFYFAFFILEYLRLVSLLPGIPQNFFNALFIIMFLLSVIVCTFKLMNNLYFTKDNPLLLTLPTDRTSIFTSKIIVYYLYELIRNLSYMLPLFVAYGIINGLPLYFYLWLVVAYPIITALPVVIGALLSIPLMYITIFIKQFKTLQISLTVIGLAGVVALLIFIISKIPANIDLISSWGTTYWQIQDFLSSFNQIFAPITYIVTFVIGARAGSVNQFFILDQFWCFLGIVLCILLVLGLSYLIVRPLFFKMASSPFEYRKRKITKHKNIKAEKPFASSVKTEFLINLRTPQKLISLLTIMIGMPIAIYLLNKIFMAMDTSFAGASMAITFNILMILLFALSSSTSIAYVYSEEGASSYLKKSIPQPYLKSLFSKLVINISAITIGILASVIIVASFMHYSAINAIIIFLIIEMAYITHILWSAELDIMNPQTEQYKTTGTHSMNPNEVKSTIYALLMSAIIAVLVYFFISEDFNSVWWKVMIFVALFMVLRIWLYINKIKVYYKEKG